MEKEHKIIADEQKVIEIELVRLCDDLRVDICSQVGNWSRSTRCNPEVYCNVIERPLNGISETLRAYGQRRTPLSMLSRGIGGVRGIMADSEPPWKCERRKRIFGFIVPWYPAHISDVGRPWPLIRFCL